MCTSFTLNISGELQMNAKKCFGDADTELSNSLAQ